jgi:hypothetical protein
MDNTLTFPPFLAPHRAEASDPVVRLDPNAALARSLPAGSCVLVQAGRIWLTQSGDANDYVVDAGQCHVVTRGGRVVVESFTGSATLRLLREPPRAHAGFP